MQKKAVKGLFVAVIASLTVALSGCSGDKSGGNTSRITIGIPQDLDSLDPHKAVGAGTKEVLFNVFEGLVKPDSNGDLIPAVASSYEVSDDASRYTFTLRDGIKFQDGSPVTVQDIKYSIDKCADTKNGTPLVPAFSNIKEVKTSGESTVEVDLKEPDSDFLAYMTCAITPKANAANEETAPIGTGPYSFVSWTPQDSIVLKRFDGYWGTKAGIENVTFKVCASTDTVVSDLEGGSIDMFARLTDDQAKQIAKDQDFQVLNGTMNLVQALYLNNKVKPFDDVRVRQAMCYATDPDEIMKYVSGGRGERIGSSMYPNFTKYYDKSLNDTYTHDTAKAKELLKEAGYPDGFEFTITVPSNYQQHIDTAQVIAQQLKEVGITAKISLVEWDSWLSDVYTNRKYDATVIGVDASSLTASALLGRFVSDADNNFINFSDKKYDETYANAQKTTDDGEKTAQYKACEKILADDAANVYIQDLPCYVALNKKYTGYKFYPLYVQDIASLRTADGGTAK
jgi:peptide/nickel transport system substrate-binding protein